MEVTYHNSSVGAKGWWHRVLLLFLRPLLLLLIAALCFLLLLVFYYSITYRCCRCIAAVTTAPQVSATESVPTGPNARPSFITGHETL